MGRKKTEVLHLRVSADMLADIKRLARTDKRTDSFIARDAMEYGLRYLLDQREHSINGPIFAGRAK